MKKFELTGRLDNLELVKTVFIFTEEQEELLLKKANVLIKEEEQKGEAVSIVSNQIEGKSDIVIRAMLQARCKDGILAFVKFITKGQDVAVMQSAQSILGGIQWECKRIGCLEAVK
ncbi:MAG: hypothetical protein V4478_01200 [Patescibacteria group bacterium]